MSCLDALGKIPPVTSVIGSGGKSTLLAVLARELTAQGRTAVLATTTHFTAKVSEFPLVISDAEDDVTRAPDASGAVYVGSPVPGTQGKLGPSPIPIARLAGVADHVIVEADGSRGLPLKAHDAHEPVIPTESECCICIVGTSGFGRPVAEVVHRPELFCKRAGCSERDIATPQIVARAMAFEMCQSSTLSGDGSINPDTIVINQAERAAEAWRAARDFADAIATEGFSGSVFAGSIRDKHLERLL